MGEGYLLGEVFTVYRRGWRVSQGHTPGKRPVWREGKAEQGSSRRGICRCPQLSPGPGQLFSGRPGKSLPREGAGQPDKNMGVGNTLRPSMDAICVTTISD